MGGSLWVNIVASMTRLTKKEVSFQQSKECDLIFLKLNGLLTLAPTLTLSIEGQGIIVYCDTSSVVLGCV